VPKVGHYRTSVPHIIPSRPRSTMASEITTFPAPASDLNILVLGAGGREHALSYKLAQSKRVAKVFVAPGNGGTALMGSKVQNVSIPWGGSKGYGAVVDWAKEHKVDLVVPGPEQPLVEGVEAQLRKGQSPSRAIYAINELTPSRHPRLRSFSRCCPPRGLQDAVQGVHGPAQHPHCRFPLFHLEPVR